MTHRALSSIVSARFPSGYPIYGGRDVNGAVITTAQLDGCNGITSATPEFPNGAYHYVLPLNVTSYQSSIGCDHGTVSQTLMAQAYKRHCDMTTYQPGQKRKVTLPHRPARQSHRERKDGQDGHAYEHGWYVRNVARPPMRVRAPDAGALIDDPVSAPQRPRVPTKA